MSPSVRNRWVDRFQRRISKIQGTGLGMSVGKGFTERLGGKVHHFLEDYDEKYARGPAGRTAGPLDMLTNIRCNLFFAVCRFIIQCTQITYQRKCSIRVRLQFIWKRRRGRIHFSSGQVATPTSRNCSPKICSQTYWATVKVVLIFAVAVFIENLQFANNSHIDFLAFLDYNICE